MKNNFNLLLIIFRKALYRRIKSNRRFLPSKIQAEMSSYPTSTFHPILHSYVFGFKIENACLITKLFHFNTLPDIVFIFSFMH